MTNLDCHYTNCLPSCPPSCLDPDSRCEGSGHKVPATCREGCICQPDYVLLNDKCVLRSHCGCKDAQGVFIPVSGRRKQDWWSRPSFHCFSQTGMNWSGSMALKYENWSGLSTGHDGALPLDRGLTVHSLSFLDPTSSLRCNFSHLWFIDSVEVKPADRQGLLSFNRTEGCLS